MTIERDRRPDGGTIPGEPGSSSSPGKGSRSASLPARPSSILPAGTDFDVDAQAERDAELGAVADDAFGVHLYSRSSPGGGGGGAPATKTPGMRMRVRALRKNGPAKEWVGSSADLDLDGARLTAKRGEGGWTWDDERGASVTVRKKSPNAGGGVPVESWAPADAYLIVVDYGSAAGGSIGEGEGTGGEGGGVKDTGVTSDQTIDGKGEGTQTGDEKREESTTDGDGKQGGTGKLGDSNDGGLDELTAEGEDEGSEAMEDQLEESLLVLDLFDFEGKDDDKPGGDALGRSGDDTEADGQGDGGKNASRDGGDVSHGRGADLQDGGVDTKHNDMPGGEKFGDAAGRVGGEDGGREGGVRGAMGLFGLISVPEALRGGVEVLLILEDGMAFESGAAVFKAGAKAGAKKLTTKTMRKQLARSAREEAAKRMRRINKALVDVRGKATKALSKEEKLLVERLSKMTREERKRAMRSVQWELTRQFFDGALDAAEKEAKQVTKQLAKLPKNKKNAAKRAKLEGRLEYAEQMEDAATAQPIAGRLPKNHEFAGKDFPKDLLPDAYRAKGVKFTREGFPDFEPYAIKDVRIEYTGGRNADFRAANKAAGLDETPDEFLWHHHEDVGRMQLLPEDLHDAVKHHGGVSWHQHTHGVTKYGN